MESGTSVVLVEDEESIAEPFAKALTRAGLKTTVARTGAEAMTLVRELHPDVVLLDSGLPDANGRDLCRELRSESSVPIIIVTASGTVTDRVVGLELGADDYVVKPFATGEVVARIRAVLRRARPEPADVGEIRIRELRLTSRPMNPAPTTASLAPAWRTSRSRRASPRSRSTDTFS